MFFLRIGKFCNYIYLVACLIASIGMICFCLIKFIKNDSIVSVDYRQFHTTAVDIYPSITICFSSLDVAPHVGPFVDFGGVKKLQIAKMIRGRIWMNPIIKNSTYDDFTINIEDVLKRFFIIDKKDVPRTIFLPQQPKYQSKEMLSQNTLHMT